MFVLEIATEKERHAFFCAKDIFYCMYIELALIHIEGVAFPSLACKKYRIDLKDMEHQSIQSNVLMNLETEILCDCSTFLLISLNIRTIDRLHELLYLILMAPLKGCEILGRNRMDCYQKLMCWSQEKWPSI